MLKYYFVLFLFILISHSNADTKYEIITNLKNINNFDFKFEQNTNGKLENGNCTIQYPKKIFCKYAKNNGKILVSNGKSLVIKTRSSFYRYPLEKTPLNFILDKDFLIDKINNIQEQINNEDYISYQILVDDKRIDIFFDKKTFDLIGWENTDIYQNSNVTFIYSIKKNRVISEKLFKLPSQN